MFLDIGFIIPAVTGSTLQYKSDMFFYLHVLHLDHQAVKMLTFGMLPQFSSMMS